MKDKVVLITGANGGLGSYITQAFLDTGAMVVGSSRKIQQSDFPKSNFVAIPAELSDRHSANALIETVLRRFGKLDVLAHTVGGFAGGQSVVQTDEATFQNMMDLNLNSLFHICAPPFRFFARAAAAASLRLAAALLLNPERG